MFPAMSQRRPLLAIALLALPTLPLAAQPAPVATPATATAPAATPRRIAVGDVDRIATVRDPQRSPDGAWVAYAVGTVDVAKDKIDSDIWMVKWDGSERV